MKAADCQLFDFRKAGFVDESVGRYLRAWLAKTAKIFQQRWPEICNSKIEVVPQPLFTQSFSSFIESCGQTSFGCVIRLGLNDLPSMLAVQQVDLLALVLEILAEDLSGKPQSRPLTAIEINLSELLIEQFCAAAAEGWPQKETMTFKTEPIDSAPHRSRLFNGDEPITVAQLAIRAKAGEALLTWGFPRAQLAKALKPIIGESAGDTRTLNPLPVVQEIPLEVVVQLGSAKLGMEQLMSLEPGSVIVLEQRIDQPLMATIEHLGVYRGWPGRVAGKQAFKITAVS